MEFNKLYEDVINTSTDPLDRIILRSVYGNETIREFMQRHDELHLENGVFHLYHATPKKQIMNNNVLRAWSYLDVNRDRAISFAGRDRGLSANKIKVYDIYLKPEELEYSGHYQNNVDIPLDRNINGR